MVTDRRKVAVLGGTGFLGRRVVRHLLDRDFAVRLVSRHPERGERLFCGKSSRLELIQGDISDDASVSAVVAGVFGVVNAVSLYVEQSGWTFHSVHVEAAARVAMHSKSSGVARLIHVSGIGANATSPSPYIRSRGEGEIAVRAAFPAATMIRPAVMFGPDDAFLMPLIKLLRKSPVFPLFGRGRTALQPAFVEDVAQAIARTLDASQPQPVYELGGPHIYTYEDLLRTVGDHLGSQRVLIPMPFEIWQVLALLAEHLPQPPITRNQVELMRIDNVASPACAGFGTLGIEPRGIETVLGTKQKADEQVHQNRD
jgi:NADH dehydrogenase